MLTSHLVPPPPPPTPTPARIFRHFSALSSLSFLLFFLLHRSTKLGKKSIQSSPPLPPPPTFFSVFDFLGGGGGGDGGGQRLLFGRGGLRLGSARLSNSPRWFAKVSKRTSREKERGPFFWRTVGRGG